MAPRKAKARAKVLRGAARLQVVRVRGSAALVEHGPEWGGWRGDAARAATGALVKVTPPGDATDEQIAGVLDALRDGATGVLLMPRQNVADVATVAPEEGAPPKRRGHRDIVDEMVAAMTGVDSAALAALVAEIMDAEGL